jgi:hypothetical protein
MKGNLLREASEEKILQGGARSKRRSGGVPLPKGFLKNSRDLSPLPEGMRSHYLRSKKFRK